MKKTFGQIICEARRGKGYSQRDLADRVKLHFTYLSKLENDRADTPPSEESIRLLARNLDLDEEELIFLAGRIPHCYQKLIRENYKEMPALLRQLQRDQECEPEFQE
ncbi:MAG TPA: XRE family transcriptional regulator [Cyanobacteria bacterium UBA12227]|nr:XRE family transcriptional regulator [Cyanobacteria bacterium UBA12227]HAX87876.1 XRE family transcriptional regulator [Cyanobacteria bacterium UBA11370]HBY79660.1 XRE family transcriptional regulator [Cyanobacteria bacterium UBA11148]